jgi:hypothetical protein
LLVNELALSHTKMMGLVMRPADHYTDKAQAANVLLLLRVAGCHS